jgi:hypothetical protein
LYSNFILCLVQIINEIKTLVSIALASKTDLFKGVMKSKGIDAAMVDSIMQVIAECDDHLLKTFELFRNPKCIETYITEEFPYVKPTTVALGSGSFQYVSITEILKKIKNDKSFQKLRKKVEVQNTDVEETMDFCLRDVDDGLLMRSSKFHLTYRDAFRLGNITINQSIYSSYRYRYLVLFLHCLNFHLKTGAGKLCLVDKSHRTATLILTAHAGI